MTSTDTMPDPTATRTLRRSRTERVGAGVAGGLGQYFGLDPVLFRVLFATSAFFGGAGVLAYLLAWAAIPEEGTAHAPIDGWVGAMRRRHIPFWLIAVVATLLLWAVAFSWWAPGPVFPVLVVVLVLLFAFVRRDLRQQRRPADLTPKNPTPVDLSKAPHASVPPLAAGGERATWMSDTRQWIEETRDAGRRRRHRAQPVRLATLGTLLATLVVLALVDATRGILLPVYFLTSLGIAGAGLAVGLVLRRTPWSLMPIFVWALVGTIAFAGSRASLHDGFGQRTWTPTTASADYRLAFGQGVLDLRSFDPTSPTTLRVTVAAGQVRIIAPKGMNLTVDSHLHFGQLEVDRVDTEHGSGIDHVVTPPTGASGVPVTVDVHLADGQISVQRG